MMGRWDWMRLRPSFAMQGNQQHSAASKADQIMAKYRPIAPKPPLHTPSSLGKPASDSTLSAFYFLSTFNPAHNSNGGHNRSGYKRKTSDCLGIQTHSPRILKRPRGGPSSAIPSIKQDTVFSRVGVDGHEVCQTELEVMERREANDFNGNRVLDERCGGSDEWMSVKMVMESIGEGRVGNFALKLDNAYVATVAESHCGCGSSDFLVFPIAAGVEEKTDLVTLRLLPQTTQLQNVPNASYHKEGIAASNNRSCHTEGIPLRLFGTDLGHTVVESCQISNSESSKPEKIVPIVGLSFI